MHYRFWNRMSPRFLRYLAKLGVRYLHYHLFRFTGLEDKEMRFTNLEGFTDYDFSIPNRNSRPGIAAIIRAHNEADKIAYTLHSIYDLFDQIVVIDNDSDDDTVAIVRGFKAEHDEHGKLELSSYPFKIARWGAEHGETPENSVHNMTYFTNYTLSLCNVKTVCRWDADMVVQKASRAAFADFLRKLAQGTEYRWGLYGQSLFRAPNGEFLTNPADVDRETRIFPLSYHNRFFKNNEFEGLYSPLYRRVYPERVFYELKFCSADEFANWTSIDFASGLRPEREWQIIEKLRVGESLGPGYVVYQPDFLDNETA